MEYSLGEDVGLWGLMHQQSGTTKIGTVGEWSTSFVDYFFTNRRECVINTIV
jgi:hypothetical protein